MKLNSIQFLRGIAALLVVHAHAMSFQTQIAVSAQHKFYHLDTFGCIGVDLFFVISGFIIMYVASHATGISQCISFLVKRFSRINPVYYIASILYIGIYFPWLQMQHKTIEESIRQIGLELTDSLLIFPTTDTVDSFSPLLTVGWTLAFEWLFYGLFFFLILFNANRKALFLLIIIACLVFIGRVFGFHDLRLIFLTNPIMLEFLLGVILCYSYLHIKQIPAYIGWILLTGGLLGYISLILFGFGNVWHYQLTLSGEESFNRFLYWGLPSSLLVAGALILEKNGKLHSIWSNKISLLMGNSSYSIYLIHYTVLGLVTLLYIKTGFSLNPDIMIWLRVILAVIVSVAFYKFVEKPLLKSIHRSAMWRNLVMKENRAESKPAAMVEKEQLSTISY